uniref:Uncharacterized protein n=1 Tax=Ciona intestinalis TaxID=7719 RepID=H2XXC2_CIOIN
MFCFLTCFHRSTLTVLQTSYKVVFNNKRSHLPKSHANVMAFFVLLLPSCDCMNIF